MVYFKEILPNPAGRDTEGEWIKLINSGDSPINTTGWMLKDASGKSFSLTNLSKIDRTLVGGEELVIKYNTTGISLNNDGDTITLYDNTGKLVDEINYSGVVADDEIIFSSRFLPEVVEVSGQAPQLQSLAFTGQGTLANSQNIAPIFIAITIAVISSVGIGVFVRDILTRRS